MLLRGQLTVEDLAEIIHKLIDNGATPNSLLSEKMQI